MRKGDRLFSTDRAVWRAGRQKRHVVAAACALLVAAPYARAEEAGSPANRVLQMLGLGGAAESGAPPAPSPAQGTPGPSPTPGSSTPPVGEASKNRLLQMFGFGGGGDKKDTVLSECPDIIVEGGGAELRAPPTADSESVRYEIAINRMARECALKGGDISIRVGLQGSAMLGPAGQPGAYYGNIRVALRRKSDEQLLSGKTYRVGATIPAGAARQDFTLLVEDLQAPFVSSKAADDYEILVGFTGGAQADAPQKKRRAPKE